MAQRQTRDLSTSPLVLGGPVATGNSYNGLNVSGGQSHFGNIYNMLPPAQVAPKTPINLVPWPKDDDFVGRQDTLSEMRTALARQGRIALVGEGGIGCVTQKKALCDSS